jgi:hypothetical protein
MTTSSEPSKQSAEDQIQVSEASLQEDVPEIEIQADGSRDAEHWAKMVTTLNVEEAPEGAVNINVSGRRVTSPVQGFGKMWQKTYKVNLPGSPVTPTELVKEWKANFQSFWPPRNLFYGSLTGIAPGDVALLNLSMPGRLKLSTGVLVLFADDESFTFMTPQGHMFASFITFSSYEQDGDTVAQIQVLLRAGDPIYETALTFGGHRKEDKFWQHTLGALAQHFGVESPDVDTKVICVDKSRQWSNAKNIWHNAAVRSGIYMMGAPFRLVAKPFKR